MKNLDLDQTWELCLEMWKWIAEVHNDNEKKVRSLKRDWLEGRGFGTSIRGDCFFCHFVYQLEQEFVELDEYDCDYCPGKLVNDSFDCTNQAYEFGVVPVLFYQELIRLHKIRESMRG